MAIDWKIWATVIVMLVAACCVLFMMHRAELEENTALKSALASQSALLSETQAELKLRDTVIKARDAELAEAERKAEQAEGKYARLVRTSKTVRDWDAVALPDDVRGMLRAGDAGAADRAAGGADAGCGRP